MSRLLLDRFRLGLLWWCLAVPLRTWAIPPTNPLDRPLDTMAEHTRACTACHGPQGRATSEGYFPRIAGKPSGYLFNQLVNFREGRRANTAMTYLVQHLSDAYLAEIAQYFADLDLPYASPAVGIGTAQQLARGQTLVTEGDPGRGVPACNRCHGLSLTGLAPFVPGLVGLPRDYLVGQFGAWRTGQRHAATPDCMAEITARLSDDDIGALASWLSQQTVPAHPRSASAGPRPLPMHCGSVPEGLAR